jgi:hypothetical protein
MLWAIAALLVGITLVLTAMRRGAPRILDEP